MTDVVKPLFTTLATIVPATLIYVIGQILTRFVLDPIQEQVDIARFAHRAGCHRFGADCAHLASKRCHAQERVERVACSGLTKAAGLADPFAQTRRGLHLIDHADVAAGRNVGDDLAD